MGIKELDKELFGKGVVKGFKFIQLETNEYGYLYHVFDIENLDSDHYEVFKRKLVHLFDYESKTELEDQKVRYPKAKDFGSWAWTYIDYYSALGKFRSLTSKNKEVKA